MVSPHLIYGIWSLQSLETGIGDWAIPYMTPASSSGSSPHSRPPSAATPPSISRVSYKPLIIWTRPGRHKPCLLKPAGWKISTSMTNVPLSSTIGTFSPVASFRMYDPSPDLLITTVLPLSRIRLTDASGLLTLVTWNVELTASEPFLLNRTLFSP